VIKQVPAAPVSARLSPTAQLFVNQHSYGIPAAHAPVFSFRETEGDGVVRAYLDSFERVWDGAKPIKRRQS
jgi:hypothetical protein